MPLGLNELAYRWSTVQAGERANAQQYLMELCEALGVERPRGRGHGYEFEHEVKVLSRDGVQSSNFIDLYKAHHFVLEAKDSAPGANTETLLRKAFGQVRGYVGFLREERPPYVMVMDVAKTLVVWDRWAGDYGGFNAGRRIDLPTLGDRPDDAALLRDIWQNPQARDPRAHAAAVTREIAGRLAELAASLERQGHGQERVARFLMRCVFTMFAEDVGLLPGEPFRQIVGDVALAEPDEFAPAAEELWRKMDSGARYGPRKLLRFNGHLFKDPEALPLAKPDVAVLLEAAQADWRHVEPSIFGTLLVRALSPEERHRLGAEYTPREYVDRLIRPTVEEPIRERWTLTQAQVLQLVDAEGKSPRKAREDRDEALRCLRDFHAWMRGLRFLDPACGSGNFLYATMHLVKRIELEVIREIEKLTGAPELAIEEVGPAQFYGIEVKPWAREIAELTLWIGYHQFWKAHHGNVQPPEPVLTDTGTIECRDAVLAWDEIVEDPERSRPDPTPRSVHPVTGELVPDPNALLAYSEYRGARQAEWPQADYIVGNPPFMGQSRQRDGLGDGYVDALREVYPAVPDSADLVMYWWYRAAKQVIEKRSARAGLITTQSISQAQNRAVIADAADRGVRVIWAIADHYWNDASDDARVRVAMTVISREQRLVTLVVVDGEGNVVRQLLVPRLNADLTAYADVALTAQVALAGNTGLGHRGYKLHGQGFVVPGEFATRLLDADSRNADVLKAYRSGMDLSRRPRGVWLVDFGLRSETEAKGYPLLYDIIRDRVKPERDANNRAIYARYWWRFGEARPEFRQAISGLTRYIASVYTSKHGYFLFLDALTAPDDGLVCIASEDAHVLGYLSSAIHREWGLAAGSRFGIDATPRYNHGLCFDPFPFPDPPPALRAEISDLAERLDRHRKDALARGETVTMTGMYNVVEKLRSGEALTRKEQEVHTLAACGVLRDLHDELDALVAKAYGWPWPMAKEEILERLVALHDERVREEERGLVRWLRPEYQIPRFGKDVAAPAAPELGIVHGDAAPTAPAAAPASAGAPAPWPKTAIDQMAALQALFASQALTPEEAAARFAGAPRALVRRHVETLAILGELRRTGDGKYHGVVAAAA